MASAPITIICSKLNVFWIVSVSMADISRNSQFCFWRTFWENETKGKLSDSLEAHLKYAFLSHLFFFDQYIFIFIRSNKYWTVCRFLYSICRVMFMCYECQFLENKK